MRYDPVAGTTWENAYSDLQDGLAVAKQGDQVWVAAGVYKPGTAVDASFQLLSDVHAAAWSATERTTQRHCDPDGLGASQGDVDSGCGR